MNSEADALCVALCALHCRVHKRTKNNFFIRLTFLCSLIFLIAGSLGDLGQ